MTRILALQALDAAPEETAAFCISASWSDWSIKTA
jgi:hypothetical protein